MIKLVKGDEQEVGRKSLSEASDASIFPLLEKPLPLSSGSWSLNGSGVANSVQLQWTLNGNGFVWRLGYCSVVGHMLSMSKSLCSCLS